MNSSSKFRVDMQHPLVFLGAVGDIMQSRGCSAAVVCANVG